MKIWLIRIGLAIVGILLVKLIIWSLNEYILKESMRIGEYDRGFWTGIVVMMVIAITHDMKKEGYLK